MRQDQGRSKNHTRERTSRAQGEAGRRHPNRERTTQHQPASTGRQSAQRRPGAGYWPDRLEVEQKREQERRERERRRKIKLQKKRNHLNAFYKEFEGRWNYQPLCYENTDEIINFLSRWHQDDDDYMLAYEKLGILRVLENWEALDAKGGIIRIDQRIEAFTIGSRLSAQMCQTNIEKANESIRGLYQAICKEFLSHEFLDMTYVNREEDMGLETLRQAKEAYHPEYLIMKYRISEAHASH